ncbi:putative adhesin [Haloactinopolyspora alba]|uniref:Putative adhesin n=1 Tax=Haloactinopolyspora alba TaxID=648780 RepID=A0A2P8E9B5_9ACTN|nr:DUF4097 family beta strand repeat-containing protein [Haloactinopolyspora alba]PSL06066.1 putative adhesin [Haloactinopolyspora alba]
MTDQLRPREADQPVGPRPIRRSLSVAGVVAIGFAGITALSWITHSSDRVDIDERIDRVEIDVATGHVEIVGSPAGETALEFEVESGWSRDGRVEHDVDDGTLRVHGGCDSGVFLGLWCESDVTVTVPTDAVVTAEASAGSISATGLSGTTELEASAGEIRIEDQTGPLTAHSAGGRVTVDGLATDVAKVTSSAGPVTVHAVRAPDSLDAESSADDVTVTLPDDVSYDVESDSSTGDATVGVPTAAGSVYKVRAFSSAGAVDVRTR